MNARTRKLYILGMVALFLLLAPVAVFYALGYRYDFVRGQILRTGAVLVNTQPRGATVTLDGSPSRKRTPVVVRNVLPGDRTLRIERDGYTPLEKRISVLPERTTLYDAILLAPSPERWRRDRTGAGTGLVVSRDGTALAWRTVAGTPAIGRSGAEGDDAVLPERIDELLGWSAFNRYLFARRENELLVFDRNDDWHVQRFPLPGTIGRIRWHRENESFAYVLFDRETYVLDLFSGTFTPLGFTALDLIADGEGVFAIERAGLGGAERHFVARNGPRYERTETRPLPNGTHSFLSGSSKPFVTASDSVVAILDDGELTTKVLADVPRGASWSPTQSSLLVWTRNELWVFPNGDGEDQLLGRFSRPIAGAFWAGSWPSVVVRFSTTLSLVEVDPRGTRYTPELKHAASGIDHAFLRGDRLVAILPDPTDGWSVESVQLF